MTNVGVDLAVIAVTAQVLSRRLHRAGTAAVGVEQLAPSELELMQHVGAHPGSTVTEVARALRLQPSNVSTSVRGLVERGLVERRVDEHDQRRVRLWPSAAAEEHRRAVEEVWRRMLAPLVDGLGPRDAELIRAAVPALDRLARAVTAQL